MQSPERLTANTLEPTHFRKTLYSVIPGILPLIGMSGYFTLFSIPSLIDDLKQSAPVVRIWPGIALAPTMLPLGFLALFALTMKAMSLGERIIANITRLIDALVVMNFAILLLLACTSTLLQNHYLPRLGYAKCQELKGQPSPWFSDWVRDPAWCVKGKGLEWIKEQANLAASANPR
ncbi:hypothetical protein [Paracidovorax avenae]|uniref:hypothetical protein n=1 Tax=Paracidovorax avenae TaxID=80867 RepID=UPI001AD82660|nr:hypothetical protein [Paracidovorax avenae]